MATNKEIESRINGLEATIQQQAKEISKLTTSVVELARVVETLSNRPVEVSTKGGGKATSTYVLHFAPTEGIQPQARKCMAMAVAQFGTEVVITEPELVAFIRSKQAEISVNQDAWSKVFAFYRTPLQDMGALTWNK